MLEFLYASYFLAALCLVCAILLLRKYERSVYDYWPKLNIKCAKAAPIFGNIAPFVLHRKAYHEITHAIYEALPDEPWVGYYQMHKPVLLVKDPELVSSILIKNFKTFVNRGLPVILGHSYLPGVIWWVNVVLCATLKIADFFHRSDRHLVTAKGDRWRFLRQKMNSAFTPSKIKSMYGQMTYCTTKLTDHVDEQIRKNGGEGVDMSAKRLADVLTCEVIGICGFGVECHAFEGNLRFIEASHAVFKPTLLTSLRLLTTLWGKHLCHKFGLPEFNCSIKNYFVEFALDLLEYRRQKDCVRDDFMQLLVNMQNSHVQSKHAVAECGKKYQPNEEFHEIDVASNSYVFFAAGLDTSSLTLSYCLYELALNENIQEKLRAEMLQIKEEESELNLNSFKRMPYLNAIINAYRVEAPVLATLSTLSLLIIMHRSWLLLYSKKTLRKYPPLPLTSRKSIKDFIVPETGVMIRAGTDIVIPVWSIHHDQQYYPNPEVFDPERFMFYKNYKQPSGQYIPFADGPRNCIGKSLAMLVLKVSISTIILNYNLKPCSKTEIPLKFNGGTILLHTSCGVWINFTKYK